MLRMPRNRYIRSIEDSLRCIPEGHGTENIPRHVDFKGLVDEAVILTWNRGLYTGIDLPDMPYQYTDIGMTYHAPSHRQSTHVGFWTPDGRDSFENVTFVQYNAITLSDEVEKVDPPTQYNGSPKDMSLSGLRKISSVMRHSVELLKITDVEASTAA